MPSKTVSRPVSEPDPVSFDLEQIIRIVKQDAEQKERGATCEEIAQVVGHSEAWVLKKLRVFIRAGTVEAVRIPRKDITGKSNTTVIYRAVAK